MNQTEKAILKISQSKEKLKEFLSKNTMDELYEFILKEDDTILRTEFEEFMIDALENCPEISRALTEKDLAKIAGGKSNFNKKLISTALSALTILPTATPLAGAAEPANGSSAESSATSKKEVDKKKKSSIWSRLLKLAAIPSALGLAALGYCKLRNTDDHTEELNMEKDLQYLECCSLCTDNLEFSELSYPFFLSIKPLEYLRDETFQASLLKFNTTFFESLKTEILGKYGNKFDNLDFVSTFYDEKQTFTEQTKTTQNFAQQLLLAKETTKNYNKLVLQFLLSLLCELLVACHNLPLDYRCATHPLQPRIRDYLREKISPRLENFKAVIEKIGLPFNDIMKEMTCKNPSVIILEMIQTAAENLQELS